jgi:hypothetical protein
VERPRRKVRFARLIDRRGRALGRPSAGAAFGGNLSLTWRSPRVICRIAKNGWRNLRRHLEPTSAPEPMGLPALSTTQRPFHPEGAGVALGIGKEVSWMREITLEDYKHALPVRCALGRQGHYRPTGQGGAAGRSHQERRLTAASCGTVPGAPAALISVSRPDAAPAVNNGTEEQHAYN